MKTMKGLSMNRMLTSIRKKSGTPTNAEATAEAAQGQTPEVIALNNAKAFCESGGNVKGDEVTFLPLIVDAAESSPAAAAEAARAIRKYLGKEYLPKSTWQYNALMLLRILTDNPGATFTRNFDQKFVDTVKALLKSVKATQVRQILMETLDDFESSRTHDENLALLVSMWKEEKEKALKEWGDKVRTRSRRDQSSRQQPGYNSHSQNYFARAHSNNRLPDPVELTGRLEEARSSSKLLEQLVMNTPPAEFLDNELIREFADRCLSASRSIQGYMTAQDPAPDNDTMESMIDTNEQLQSALNQHQRARLNAKKQLGLDVRSDESLPTQQQQFEQINGQVQRQDTSTSGSFGGGGLFPTAGDQDADFRRSSKGKENQTYGSGANGSGAGRSRYEDVEVSEEEGTDPFRDPQVGGSSSSNYLRDTPKLTLGHDEPFNVSFNNAKGKQTQNLTSSAGVGGSDAKATLTTGVSEEDDLYEATPITTKNPAHNFGKSEDQ